MSLFLVLVLGGIVVAVLAPLINAHVSAKTLTESESGALSYSRRKFFFSPAERSFYEILRPLLPNHTVFAKVRLADVIYVPRGTAGFQSHFNRIQSKHIDFVLCDQSLAPVLVIELDDSSHDQEHRQKRDAFVDAALASAALPIVHIRAQRTYTLEEVRTALRPHLGLGPNSAPTPALASLPSVDVRSATGRDRVGESSFSQAVSR